MIDLDALAAELRAAGWEGIVTDVGHARWIDATEGVTVWDDGQCFFPKAGFAVDSPEWKVIDIIRRHVGPRPADDLRERVARALDNYLRLDWSAERRQENCGPMADAVLAVIGGEAGAQGVSGERRE